MKLDVVGLLSFTKHEIPIGDKIKTVYVLGEKHVEIIKAAVNRKDGPLFATPLEIIEIIVNNGQKQGNKIHMFLECGGFFIDKVLPSLPDYSNYYKLREYSSIISTMWYIIGMYKNLIKEWFIDNFPYNASKLTKLYNANYISDSNFIKNVDMHLVDFRNQIKAIEDPIQLRRDHPYFSGPVTNDFFKKMQLTESYKFICELDDKGNYETVFGKMLKKLNLSDVQINTVDNIPSLMKPDISYCGVMDVSLLMKLLYYIDSNNRVETEQKYDEADTIVIYCGDTHAKMYNEFIKNMYPDTKTLKKSNQGWIEQTTIDDTILPFLDSYMSHISRIRSVFLHIPNQNINECLFFRYLEEDMDIEYRNTILESKEILRSDEVCVLTWKDKILSEIYDEKYSDKYKGKMHKNLFDLLLSYIKDSDKPKKLPLKETKINRLFTEVKKIIEEQTYHDDKIKKIMVIIEKGDLTRTSDDIFELLVSNINSSNDEEKHGGGEQSMKDLELLEFKFLAPGLDEVMAFYTKLYDAVFTRYTTHPITSIPFVTDSKEISVYGGSCVIL